MALIIQDYTRDPYTGQITGLVPIAATGGATYNTSGTGPLVTGYTTPVTSTTAYKAPTQPTAAPPPPPPAAPAPLPAPSFASYSPPNVSIQAPDLGAIAQGLGPLPDIPNPTPIAPQFEQYRPNPITGLPQSYFDTQKEIIKEGLRQEFFGPIGTLQQTASQESAAGRLNSGVGKQIIQETAMRPYIDTLNKVDMQILAAQMEETARVESFNADQQFKFNALMGEMLKADSANANQANIARANIAAQYKAVVGQLAAAQMQAQATLGAAQIGASAQAYSAQISAQAQIYSKQIEENVRIWEATMNSYDNAVREANAYNIAYMNNYTQQNIANANNAFQAQQNEEANALNYLQFGAGNIKGFPTEYYSNYGVQQGWLPPPPATSESNPNGIVSSSGYPIGTGFDSKNTTVNGYGGSTPSYVSGTSNTWNPIGTYDGQTQVYNGRVYTWHTATRSWT